jgi:cell division protein FtsZ
MHERGLTVKKAFIFDSGVKEIVQIISNLIMAEGEINIGFDEIRDVLCRQGPVWITTASGIGKNRVADACQVALRDPLIDPSMTMSAKKVLLNITGPLNLLLYEVDVAVDIVTEKMSTLTDVIFGVSLNSDSYDEVQVTILAV